MKKKALLYVSLAPFIYVYGLAENHFNFSNSIRGFTLDFIYEYMNAWRILFGKEYKDNSTEVALFEYKLKAKKAKFDVELALLMKELYGTWNTRFYKKEREMHYRYSFDSGDKIISVKQLGDDEFTLEYYNDAGWNKKRTLNTNYILSKDNVIDIIKMIKSQ